MSSSTLAGEQQMWKGTPWSGAKNVEVVQGRNGLQEHFPERMRVKNWS